MAIRYGSAELDEDGHPVDSLLKTVVNGAWLDKQEFPPLVELVPGIICEGFGLLVGPPKAGKSWMVGNLALACASGGYAFGKLKVDQRPVLYLALEDGHRRLQSRFRTLNDGTALPAALDMLVTVEHGQVLATVAEWLLRHRTSAPLVILDTLGKARPQRRAGDDPYLADYKFGTDLKTTVDEFPGAALLAVHHSRKAVSDDFVDAVSGTQGIAGSADYVLVLARKRKSSDAVLAITGRDVAEREIALKTSEGRWTLDGFDLAEAERAVEQRSETALGDQTLTVLKFVNDATTEVNARSVAANVPGVAENAARTILGRLVEYGQITKTGRGKYLNNRVANVASVANTENAEDNPTSNNSQNATDATNVTPLFNPTGEPK